MTMRPLMLALVLLGVCGFVSVAELERSLDEAIANGWQPVAESQYEFDKATWLFCQSRAVRDYFEEIGVSCVDVGREYAAAAQWAREHVDDIARSP